MKRIFEATIPSTSDDTKVDRELAINTTTTLNLHNNQVGAKGAKALAEALVTNTTLTNLES